MIKEKIGSRSYFLLKLTLIIFCISIASFVLFYEFGLFDELLVFLNFTATLFLATITIISSIHHLLKFKPKSGEKLALILSPVAITFTTILMILLIGIADISIPKSFWEKVGFIGIFSLIGIPLLFKIRFLKDIREIARCYIPSAAFPCIFFSFLINPEISIFAGLFMIILLIALLIYRVINVGLRNMLELIILIGILIVVIVTTLLLIWIRHPVCC